MLDFEPLARTLNTTAAQAQSFFMTILNSLKALGLTEAFLLAEKMGRTVESQAILNTCIEDAATKFAEMSEMALAHKAAMMSAIMAVIK